MKLGDHSGCYREHDLNGFRCLLIHCIRLVTVSKDLILSTNGNGIFFHKDLAVGLGKDL